MATQFAEILRVLSAGDVRYILIGGLAGITHGLARFTQDVDVVYDRDPANIQRLVTALAPYSPYLRGAPPGLPFRWDATTVSRGLNFTLDTGLGAVDLLGEVTGGGTYDELLPHAERITYEGETVLRVSLAKLILLKRAAGRPKDFEAIAELEALLEETKRHP